MNIHWSYQSFELLSDNEVNNTDVILQMTESVRPIYNYDCGSTIQTEYYLTCKYNRYTEDSVDQLNLDTNTIYLFKIKVYNSNLSLIFEYIRLH